jgi:RNA polymerase II subunit A small phosphatase-like protein
MPRPLLILDLDETLIYAAEDGRDPPPPRTDLRVGRFSVQKRPLVHAFLADVAEHYDLAVWTSSSSSYARPIVDALFPGAAGTLAFVWCADRCTRRFDPETRDYFRAKDLRKVKRLGHPLERVLIVDDSPEKIARHYGNHIRVTPFTGDDADTELRDLVPFLRRLATVPNVRTIEKRNWRQRPLPAPPAP